MIRLLVALMPCMAIVACSNGASKMRPGAPGATSSVTMAPGNQMPPPEPSDMVPVGRPYVVGPFDKLVVDVFGIEELSEREVQVDAGGRISFPFAGMVEAGGKTPFEIGEILRTRLRASHIRDPQVTVNLKETVSQVVTVDGQVKEPGRYPVIGKMTLIQSVAVAKGLGEFAKLDDVVVFRTVRGQKLAALYNLNAIRRGYYDDPEIFAGDIVVVGDSSAKRLFKDIIQLVPLLTTPLVIALQN